MCTSLSCSNGRDESTIKKNMKPLINHFRIYVYSFVIKHCKNLDLILTFVNLIRSSSASTKSNACLIRANVKVSQFSEFFK